MNEDTLHPRENRSRVIIRAIVHGPFGSENERRIRDLSATGACIEQSGNLIVGDEVTLEIGALTGVAAKVVWVSEWLAGISFAEPIDLAAASRSRMRTVTAASGWATL
jgi:hypothetical protein